MTESPIVKQEKGLIDKYNRRIDYLRLSITDRCNLRCRYCMPEEGVKMKQPREIMSYEEILTLARAAAACGLSRIRLTGGEPLVRKGVVSLVRELYGIEGISEISMTTNGILLAEMAPRLYEAGLRRVNISIDTLDPEAYKHITRWGKLDKVMAGLHAAVDVGMEPVKINVVVQKGFNDDLEPFVALIYKLPVHVRFIEYMPAFYEERRDKFVSGEELEAKIRALGDTYQAQAPAGAGPARYFFLPGAKGTLGLIGSSKGHFCASCNRLRLTADGKLRTCLFSEQEIDVLKLMRDGVAGDALTQVIRDAIANKPKDRFEKREGKVSRGMSQIGG